jgi:uncharacterized protein YjbI with pentapeptide repeats
LVHDGIRFTGNGLNCLSATFNDFTNSNIVDCIFSGVVPGTINTPIQITNTIFSNCGLIIDFYTGNISSPINVLNCTFANCNYIQLRTLGYNFRSCIFYTCNIAGTSGNIFYIQYSLLYHCNWLFNNVSGNGGVLYPLLPSGYSYYSSLDDLQAGYLAVFSTASFNGCSVADPLFNNPNIEDYSLQFASPAKNVSYFGTYGGARSIAFAIKARSVEAEGDSDFASNINFNVSDDSIKLIDGSIDAQIDTNCIVNGIQRALKSIPMYGIVADRNGQYIDSISDLDIVIKSTSDSLSVPVPYVVESGAITYNSTIFQPGDRFTTVTGITSFTSSASGVLREIIEAPQRHTVMMRFGNGGGSVSAGDALTVDYWYYVEFGGITYESIVYSVGKTFKAVNTNPFTGMGTVVLALSTEIFNHFEPGIQPTTNNVGDVVTGDVIRGNGDPDYARGEIGVNEFAVNAKFIQFRFYLKINNLRP